MSTAKALLCFGVVLLCARGFLASLFDCLLQCRFWAPVGLSVAIDFVCYMQSLLVIVDLKLWVHQVGVRVPYMQLMPGKDMTSSWGCMVGLYAVCQVSPVCLLWSALMLSPLPAEARFGRLMCCFIYAVCLMHCVQSLSCLWLQWPI